MESVVLFAGTLELFFVTLELLFVKLLSFGDLTHDIRQRYQFFTKTNVACLEPFVFFGGLLENRLGLGLALHDELHCFFDVHRS